MNKKFWKNKKIFITGSTGLLGYWVTKNLVDADANVSALIHRGVPKVFEPTFSKVNIIKGDITDYKKITSILKKNRIEIIFHLAANTNIPHAYFSPLPMFDANIKGAWVVLEAARQYKEIKAILFASSDKAYGDGEKLPFTEKTYLKGKHPYNASKSCSDLIAQSYFTTYSLPLCITRCGNFYGGGDLNFQRLIPSIIKSVLFNEPLVLRSDGKHIRDFFYVEDGAKASIELVEKMYKNPKIIGQDFNFSNGKPLTVLELVELILKKMNSNIKPQIQGLSKGEVKSQYLSSRKARTMLGWKPSFTLETGLVRTISWYEEYFRKTKLN